MRLHISDFNLQHGVLAIRSPAANLARVIFKPIHAVVKRDESTVQSSYENFRTVLLGGVNGRYLLMSLRSEQYKQADPTKPNGQVLRLESRLQLIEFSALSDRAGSDIFPLYLLSLKRAAKAPNACVEGSSHHPDTHVHQALQAYNATLALDSESPG